DRWGALAHAWLLRARRARSGGQAPLPDLTHGIEAIEPVPDHTETRCEQQPVPEDRREQELDVLRLDVRAPVYKRPCARHALERNRPAHRCAQLDHVEPAR